MRILFYILQSKQASRAYFSPSKASDKPFLRRRGMIEEDVIAQQKMLLRNSCKQFVCMYLRQIRLYSAGWQGGKSQKIFLTA